MKYPWKNEPSQLDWIDDKTGLSCAMRRGPMGHWCGYIGVNETHPWYGLSYNESIIVDPKLIKNSEATVDEVGIINIFCANPKELKRGIAELNLLVRCHGGLTFSGHLPSLDGHKHWFGFDCAHSGDLCPGLLKYDYYKENRDTYRDQDYVMGVCAKLAHDIKKFEITNA